MSFSRYNPVRGKQYYHNKAYEYLGRAADIGTRGYISYKFAPKRSYGVQPLRSGTKRKRGYSTGSSRGYSVRDLPFRVSLYGKRRRRYSGRRYYRR